MARSSTTCWMGSCATRYLSCNFCVLLFVLLGLIVVGLVITLTDKKSFWPGFEIGARNEWRFRDLMREEALHRRAHRLDARI